jgi:hypothetical protein
MVFARAYKAKSQTARRGHYNEVGPVLLNCRSQRRCPPGRDPDVVHVEVEVAPGRAALCSLNAKIRVALRRFQSGELTSGTSRGRKGIARNSAPKRAPLLEGGGREIEETCRPANGHRRLYAG